VTLSLYLAVAAGGVIGAPLRYLLDTFVSDRWPSELPWGTAAVNTSGSLLFGLLTGLALAHHLGPIPKALLAVGFCGAFTTFSTFTYETMQLVEDGRILQAGLAVAGAVVAGLLAAAAGLAIGLAV
jgi:CrcB protein